MHVHGSPSVATEVDVVAILVVVAIPVGRGGNTFGEISYPAYFFLWAHSCMDRHLARAYIRA